MKAQLFGSEKWINGKYYSRDGKVVNGLISYKTQEKGILGSAGSSFIFYKTDKSSKKIKITPDSLKAFVIGPDSFVVSHFDELKKIPFLQVMVDGPLKLYFSTISTPSVSTMAMNGNGTFTSSRGFYGSDKTTYYYGETPDQITELDRKSFIDVMSKVMADKPAVVNEIKNKKYKFSLIYDLIEYYKTGVIPAKKTDDAY